MKKTLLGLGIVALLASCGGSSAEDVNVAEMKDACGCTEGLVTIANDILDNIGDKSEDDMEGDKELMKTMKPKFDKLDELENKCRKELEVEMEDMEKCDPELKTLMKKFEEKF
jgi:hypothetical protein